MGDNYAMDKFAEALAEALRKMGRHFKENPFYLLGVITAIAGAVLYIVLAVNEGMLTYVLIPAFVCLIFAVVSLFRHYIADALTLAAFALAIASLIVNSDWISEVSWFAACGLAFARRYIAPMDD